MNYEMEAQQEVDWSAGLPGDLLNYIGTLLAVPGRICFRAVCRTWRAAMEEHESPAMPTPWAVIPRAEGCSDSFTVLSAPTLNSFQWTPPGGAPARCVGSNAGWLALVTVVPEPHHIGISLVNPITDARVDLPPSPCWIPDCSPAAVERELDMIVQKVAFAPRPSASAHAAAFVSLGGRTVVYARAGINDDDGVWRLLSEVPSAERGVRRELDVAYHGGKFYYMDTRGQVWVADMAAQRPAPVPLAWFACPDLPRQLAHRRRGYHLAFSGEGALHVVWSVSEGDGVARGPGRPEMFVMRYEEASASWAAAASVGGDRAFLIGDRNQTMSVPVDGESSAWLRPDSVYFTNIPLCDLKAIGIVGRRGLWALDMRTGHVAWPRAESDIGERRLESELDVFWDKSLWLMPCL